MGLRAFWQALRDKTARNHFQTAVSLRSAKFANDIAEFILVDLTAQVSSLDSQTRQRIAPWVIVQIEADL